jgi:hypothetical protein
MSIFLLTSTGRSHKLNIAHVVGHIYAWMLGNDVYSVYRTYGGGAER